MYWYERDVKIGDHFFKQIAYDEAKVALFFLKKSKIQVDDFKGVFEVGGFFYCKLCKLLPKQYRGGPIPRRSDFEDEPTLMLFILSGL